MTESGRWVGSAFWPGRDGTGFASFEQWFDGSAAVELRTDPGFLVFDPQGAKMSVFRWRESWEPFRDLERQVDRLLESLPFPFPVLRFERQFPPVNLYELDDEYLLTAELPGTAPDNLELTLSGGVLTLKGKRPAPAGITDDQFRRHERVWGSWERSLNVPDRVQEDKVSAEFADGILRIHLPKAPETKARQIQVVQGNSS